MADPVAPLGGRDFVVRVADVGPRGRVGRSVELPCDQVVLPPLRTGAGPKPDPDEPDLLVLRRGHTGATDLAEWWAEERDPRYRGSRLVEVVALDGNGKAVTEWRFVECHLVALRYSPLDALHSTVLTESADISFGSVTQERIGR